MRRKAHRSWKVLIGDDYEGLQATNECWPSERIGIKSGRPIGNCLNLTTCYSSNHELARFDVAVARGRSYTIRRSASRTSSLSVHESSCKAKDDAPAPNDALGPLSLDWILLAAGAGWSNHTLGVPDAKPSVPPPAGRLRDRQGRPLARDGDAQCACQTPGSACAPFAPLRICI